MNPIFQGLLTILVGVGGCVGYFWMSNRFLDRVVYPPRAIGAAEAGARRIRIALWTMVAVMLAGILLALLPATVRVLAGGGGLVAALSWALSPDWLLPLLFVALVAAALLVLAEAGESSAGRNINRANMVRPWLFLAPAVVALGLYLAYPVVATLWLSLTDRSAGGAFVGFENYTRMMGEPKFWEAMRNNMLWLVVVPAASTAAGLLAAQLTDRIFWGGLAKSLIFMPMAISFVGASVIWKLIYDTRPAGQPQIGVLNALWLEFGGGFWSVLLLKVAPCAILAAGAALVLWSAWATLRPLVRGEGRSAGGLVLRILWILAAVLLAYLALSGALRVARAQPPFGQPQTWLTIPLWNNLFLMAVLIWIQTGFAMVILSAALRGIPEETVEAAIVDGANPWQIFFRIKVPQIMTTIVVVWTTITLVVLKVFDIVLAMTNGQWETQVLANYMYDKLFRAFDWGVGSASAMVIMILVLPILVWNVRSARREMR